jgi:hypothetical protein
MKRVVLLLVLSQLAQAKCMEEIFNAVVYGISPKKTTVRTTIILDNKAHNSRTLQEALNELALHVEKPIQMIEEDKGTYSKNYLYYKAGAEYFINGKVIAKTEAQRDEIIHYYKKSISALQNQKINYEFKNGVWEIPLRDLLPEKMKEILGTSYLRKEVQGPNCFNTSMLFHGVEKEARPLEGAITMQYLKKDFYSLRKTDALKPGDVIAIWDIESEVGNMPVEDLAHTAVYMGDNRFFHKTTMFKESPIVFETFENMLKPYQALKHYRISFHRAKK